MAVSGVQIEGLRETVRTLERFGAEAADLKAAFGKVGSLVSEHAEQIAPRRSGALAGSIRPSRTKNKSVVRAGSARVPYAGVIHFGGYNNITAQPFLTDALSERRDEAVQTVDDELRGLIRRLGLNA